MLYRPEVCNCTMPYVPRIVPAYAVRDPAYTAEVFALTLVEIEIEIELRLSDQGVHCTFNINPAVLYEMCSFTPLI